MHPPAYHTAGIIRNKLFILFILLLLLLLWAVDLIAWIGERELAN